MKRIVNIYIRDIRIICLLSIVDEKHFTIHCILLTYFINISNYFGNDCNVQLDNIDKMNLIPQEKLLKTH